MKKNILVLLLAAIIVFASCSQPSQKGSNTPVDTTVGVQDVSLDSNGAATVIPATSTPVMVQPTSSPGNSDTGPTQPPQEAGSETASQEEATVTLYYQDSKGFVIPLTRKIQNQDGLAKAVISDLVDNSDNRTELESYDLLPVLPENTQILGLNLDQETATIDFSKNLLEYASSMEERNIICSIVYTMTNFKTINYVRILIDGKIPGKLKFGTDISGTLSRKSTLINSEKVNVSTGMTKIDLYYFRNVGQNAYLLPVSVEQTVFDENELPEKIFDLYSREYSKDLNSLLPPGTKLLDSHVQNGILVLNFNSSFTNYGGTAREDGILKQIIYSVKRLKGIFKVSILVEGKEDALPEGTIVSEGLEIPSQINYDIG